MKTFSAVKFLEFLQILGLEYISNPPYNVGVATPIPRELRPSSKTAPASPGRVRLINACA